MYKKSRIKCILGAILASAIVFTGCGARQTIEVSTVGEEWMEEVGLNEEKSVDELYEAALKEDVLIIYTVSTRVTKTKEAFEAAYPGLCVEVRDLRSPDLIDAVIANFESGKGECDIVICNDCSGDFKDKLIDTAMVVPYLPQDIKEKMKPGHVGQYISFLDEAEMIYYNSDSFDKVPIKNIWELTDEKYKGRIYMPSPLRSFSTYAFVGSSTLHDDDFISSYEEYFGKNYDLDNTHTPSENFWLTVSSNMVFTNSSDEVMEALNDGNADFGIMVSSKMRYREVGYSFEPIYELNPFTGCRTTNAVMVATGAKNPNCARLFIRFLLGEADGKGEGYKPFCTQGTWSARVDVPDGNDVPQNAIDLIEADQDYLIKNKEKIREFWAECLKSH